MGAHATMTLVERLRSLGFGGNELGHEAADAMGDLTKENAQLRAVLLECKHGAEYPDQLGDMIDAALSSPNATERSNDTNEPN